MAAGTFPKPIKIGINSVAWPEEVIVEWYQSVSFQEVV